MNNQFVPYSERQLREMQQSSREDIHSIPFEEMREILAAEHALGETHLAYQRSADLLQNNGDNFRNGKKFGKYLALGLSAVVGVVTCNSAASLLTLNMPFVVQGFAVLFLGSLIGTGSKWMASMIIADLNLILYRWKKDVSLRSYLVNLTNQPNEFRIAYIDGMLELLHIVENVFLKPELLVGASILFFIEAFAGVWIIWQATEDVIQSAVGALAPIGFIIVLASVTAQFLIIPERKGQILNTYRAHASKWVFRSEDGGQTHSQVLPARAPHDGNGIHPEMTLP